MYIELVRTPVLHIILFLLLFSHMGAIDLMIFTDFIKQIPHEKLFKDFLKSDASKRKVISSTIIDGLVEKYTEDHNLLDVYTSLDKESDVNCLLTYLFYPGGIPCNPEDPEIRELAASYLTYCVRLENGTFMMRGFIGFKKKLIRSFKKTVSRYTVSHSTNESTLLPGSSPLNELTVIMSMAVRGMLTFTKSGNLTKASGALSRKLLSVGKSALKACIETVVFKYLDFALDRKLLIKKDEKYYENRPLIDEWLNRDVELILPELKAFLLSDTDFWNWETFFELLPVKPDEWLSTSIFPDSLKRDVHQELVLAEGSGLVNLQKKDDEVLISIRHKDDSQMRKMDEIEVEMAIIPDFSVIIPTEISFSSLFLFSRFGELEVHDQVYRGTISKKVVSDSLYRGTTGKELLDILSRWKTPGNIVESIKEWVREFERISVTDESLVLISDQKNSTLVNSYKPLSGLVTEIPVNSVLRIKHGKEQQVKEILETLGFDIRLPQKTGVTHELYDEFNSAQPSSLSFELVTDLEKTTPIKEKKRGRTKYGSELKKLSGAELENVIDYALLMGEKLSFEYSGSAGIKRNRYNVIPKHLKKGLETYLEAEDLRTGRNKKFICVKIVKIGVIAE